MKPSAHPPRLNFPLAVLCAALLCFQATNGLAQRGARVMRRPPEPAKGNSSVKGRVIYVDNLEPLKRVRLRVFTVGDNPSELTVFANERGEYRIDNLAAGKYYVALEGTGVAMPSGMGMKIPLPLSAIPTREEFEPIVPRHDATFTLDGTNSIEVEIRVERGGKVAGKVFKPDGSPANDVAVSVISRAAAVAGPFTSRFSARTDKEGRYQFENLPAGDYVVAASIENKKGEVPSRPPGTEGGNEQRALEMLSRLRGDAQIVTYHPAATSLRDALTIHVDAGANLGGVNVTLVDRQSFSISGTVVRQRDGTALAGATVVLLNKEAEFSGSLIPGAGQRTTRTDADGRWSFKNIVEGSYEITALSPLIASSPTGDQPIDREEAYRRSRPRFSVVQQNVILAGGSLDNLLLSIPGSGSITGTVELDNGQALPAGLVLFFELARDGARPGPPLPVRVQPDGSFNLTEVQGGNVYIFAALPPGSNYFVKSVTSNGKDLRGTPLSVVEDAIAGPIQVVISDETARLRGRVSSASGADDFVVMLVPVGAGMARFRSAVLFVRTGADGSYSKVLAPGEYYVLARRREQLPSSSEEFLSKEAAKATRVTIGPGEEKQLDLRAP